MKEFEQLKGMRIRFWSFSMILNENIINKSYLDHLKFKYQKISY